MSTVMTDNEIEQVEEAIGSLEATMDALLELLPHGDHRRCLRSSWRRLNRAVTSGEVFGPHQHIAFKNETGRGEQNHEERKVYRTERTE
jgi:hypothetical protein